MRKHGKHIRHCAKHIRLHAKHIAWHAKHNRQHAKHTRHREKYMHETIQNINDTSIFHVSVVKNIVLIPDTRTLSHILTRSLSAIMPIPFSFLNPLQTISRICFTWYHVSDPHTLHFAGYISKPWKKSIVFPHEKKIFGIISTLLLALGFCKTYHRLCFCLSFFVVHCHTLAMTYISFT